LHHKISCRHCPVSQFLSWYFSLSHSLIHTLSLCLSLSLFFLSSFFSLYTLTKCISWSLCLFFSSCCLSPFLSFILSRNLIFFFYHFFFFAFFMILYLYLLFVNISIFSIILVLLFESNFLSKCPCSSISQIFIFQIIIIPTEFNQTFFLLFLLALTGQDSNRDLYDQSKLLFCSLDRGVRHSPFTQQDFSTFNLLFFDSSL